MTEAESATSTTSTPPPVASPAVLASGTPAPTDEIPVVVIEPDSGLGLGALAELWRFRELLLFLVWRDVKVRYKQTVLGLAWAVAQPLATMLVFALFLGRAAGVKEGVEHYPLFVFAAMVGWSFFINIVTNAGNSVVANERLVTKVYFPRLLIPLSTVGVAVFDLLIASALLAGLMLLFGVAPGWSLLLVPVVVLMLGVAASGFGILFAALIVAQRDFKYVLAFASQLWLFATPCIYMSAEALGPTARDWVPLNPAYGLVQAFRQVALGEAFDWYSFAVSSAVGVAVFVAGVVYFRRTERSFADTI